MLCPEGYQVPNENGLKEVQVDSRKKSKNVPGEGTSGLELNSYKRPKTWKKSISNFFRNQLRSTRSNDGDKPSAIKERVEEINTEQKWQSLGKVFRRQSFGDHWTKSPGQQGECSSQNKRFAVRKVISSYFGKSPKSLPMPTEK